MAGILSRIIGAWSAVGHSRETDVSTTYLRVKRLWEPDLSVQSTDSTSSRALGCHLWPTFPERPAFTRRVVQALIFHRSFKPAIHRGEDR